MQIDLFHPFVPKEAIEAVGECLRGRFIGQGPKVDLFEKLFCEKFSLNNAVALNSGTSALETAYDLIGIGPGDEVITTPLTCTATNLPLLRRGAKLIWADIDPNTLCIDAKDVQRKINICTKAVVQVHLGGINADIGRHFSGQIPLVSDAAQALGIFNGDYTCCSFQAIKHLTTGDGGMIWCNKQHEAHQAKLYRWFGIDRDKKIANNWQAYKERKMTFDIEVPGTKRQMTDIAAVMGIAALPYYEKIMSQRWGLAKLYQSLLSQVPGIRVINGLDNKWWLLTVIVEDRDNFAKKLFEYDIDTNVVQVRNDIYKIFGAERQDLPVMNMLENKYLCLPIGTHVSVEDVHYICDTIARGW